MQIVLKMISLFLGHIQDKNYQDDYQGNSRYHTKQDGNLIGLEGYKSSEDSYLKIVRALPTHRLSTEKINLIVADLPYTLKLKKELSEIYDLRSSIVYFNVHIYDLMKSFEYDLSKGSTYYFNILLKILEKQKEEDGNLFMKSADEIIDFKYIDDDRSPEELIQDKEVKRILNRTAINLL